jgi:parallel beta-helix repeat protein
MKKILIFGIMLLFVGTCIIPNVNSIISKKDTLSYDPLDYNYFSNYPDTIYCKITNPFDLMTPDHQKYKIVYDNKDFSIIQTDSKFVKKSSRPLLNGNTLYVGGSGPGNYSKIQDAIDNANPGDTVFVYDDSSPYYEREISILKSINLIGENRETTIIDGQHKPWGIEIGANGVTITGLTIQNFSSPNYNPYNLGGIFIQSSNNIISGNIISNSGYGIIITGSNFPANYNTISDNIIESNGDCGAYIQKSNNNVISMNTFSGNYYFGGLALETSRYNNVSDNVFINDGVYFYDSYKNTFLNNMVNDKPLMYLEEESDRVLGENAGQVILIKCDNVTVQNQDLSNTSIGLFLCYTNNCLILNNTLSSSDYCGILLYRSNNNNISKNIISNEYVGISIIYSFGNTVLSNTISFSSWLGILIRSSNSNNILNNTFSDNWCGLDLEYDSEFNNISGNIFINDGAWVYNAWRNTFLNNYVNNKPLIYLEDESDIIIDENAGQVILVSCDNITVQDQELSNTFIGIMLMDTHNCLISDNIFASNNQYGIFLTHSNNNNISMNTISDNSVGIAMSISDENIILGNAIKSNNYYGIWFSGVNYTIVSHNTIEKNGEQTGVRDGLGVFLGKSSNNEINYNNFLNNARDAYFHESFSNNWNRNYWNRPRLLPKIIIGETTGLPPFDIRFNLDWRPALKPYDV